jgi:hypothetical protein
MVGVTGCSAKDGGIEGPIPPGVGNLSPVDSTVMMVGTNCRAEVITGPNGANHYKSTYFSIFGDGSEQVQNVVETETPCP